MLDYDFTHKWCNDCKEKRPISEFGKNASRYDGLTTYCHEHQLIRDRARRQRNPGKHREYMNTYNAKKKAVKVEQQAMFVGVPRPSSGKRCACGKVLYHYENGKCLKCIRTSIITARESVPTHLTDEATRNRTRRNYHVNKAIGD